MFNGYFGGGTDGEQNTLTCHYRYKETTETWDAQTWNNITATVDGSGNISFSDYINGDLGNNGFTVDKSFNVEIRAYDKLTAIIVEGTVDKGTPVIDITKNGISIMRKYDNARGGGLQLGGFNVEGCMRTGWIPAIDTFTYASASTMTVAGDVRDRYSDGMRIRLMNPSVKYFVIEGVSYSSPNTTITVYSGGFYSLTNDAISDVYISTGYAPLKLPHRAISRIPCMFGHADNNAGLTGAVAVADGLTYGVGDNSGNITVGITFGYTFKYPPIVHVPIIFMC